MEREDKNMQAEPSEAQENPKKQPQPKGYEAYLSLFDLVRMLAVITLVFVFFFRLNGVSGSSMYPTLVDKDYLVRWRAIFSIGTRSRAISSFCIRRRFPRMTNCWSSV